MHHGLWLDGTETAAEAVLRLITVVAGEARIGTGTCVCDIGCGYGGTARELVNRYGANVTAFTISPAQYDFARKRAAVSANPEYLLRDWLTNELSAGSQDVFTAVKTAGR